VTGTVTQLHRDRGTGSLVGEDERTYSFRRSDLRDAWFHELTEGARVTFEAAKNLTATQIRLLRPSA
jgi:cold shock CspA family protein